MKAKKGIQQVKNPKLLRRKYNKQEIPTKPKHHLEAHPLKPQFQNLL